MSHKILLPLQAGVTLQWLLGNNHLQSKPAWQPDEPELELAKALWTLLHGCLFCYIPDQSLEMFDLLMDILVCATASLQQPALQDGHPLTHLVTAALGRIAGDPALFEMNPGASRETAKAYHFFILCWFSMVSPRRCNLQLAACLLLTSSWCVTLLQCNKHAHNTLSSDILV